MPARLFLGIHFLPRALPGNEEITKDEYFALSGNLGREISDLFELRLNVKDRGDLATVFPVDMFDDGLGEELLCYVNLGFVNLGIKNDPRNPIRVPEKCREAANRCADILADFAERFLPQCTSVSVELRASCGSYTARMEKQWKPFFSWEKPISCGTCGTEVTKLGEVLTTEREVCEVGCRNISCPSGDGGFVAIGHCPDKTALGLLFTQKAIDEGPTCPVDDACGKEVPESIIEPAYEWVLDKRA